MNKPTYPINMKFRNAQLATLAGGAVSIIVNKNDRYAGNVFPELSCSVTKDGIASIFGIHRDGSAHTVISRVAVEIIQYPTEED